MSLPTCRVQHPSCGACGLETRFDEVFYCEECQLNYGDGEDFNEAVFLDDEAAPCSTACDNSWHGPHKIKDGWLYQCIPCPLPAGHHSDHWNPCDLQPVAA